jgi:hypothetical protein
LRWLADATPATAELLRLMDATPVPCGTSAVTAKRSDLFGVSLANPKMHGERDQARQTLERQPANRPAPGTAVVTDKGLSGHSTEEF